VNKITVTKYQLLFRHLFNCRNVEARICAAWLNDQSTKVCPHPLLSLSLSLSLLLSERRRSMIFVASWRVRMGCGTA
jgi:hypothetical protein